MDRLSFLQRQVLNEAVMKLQTCEDFEGVCLENFPSDSEIDTNFKKAVAKVISNTEHWGEEPVAA